MWSLQLVLVLQAQHQPWALLLCSQLLQVLLQLWAHCGLQGSPLLLVSHQVNITALTGDLVALLDAVGVERAALVGHDWGAVVAWSTPLLHPDRVAAVAGLSVPPVPRPLRPPTEAFRRIFGDNFFYILYFQQPGVADAEMAADPARAMRRMLGGMRAPAANSGNPTSADEAAALRMLAPGPEVAAHTPTVPSALAYPSAMWMALSSWRVTMCLIEPRSFRAR